MDRPSEANTKEPPSLVSRAMLRVCRRPRTKKCPKESVPTLSSHPHQSSQCRISPKPGTSRDTDDPISSPKPTTMTEVNDDVDEDFTEILDHDVSLGEASRQKEYRRILSLDGKGVPFVLLQKNWSKWSQTTSVRWVPVS